MSATVHQLRPVPIRNDDLRTAAWNLFIAELDSGLFDAAECRTRFSQHVRCVEAMETARA